MLADFQSVWSVFGWILNSFPRDITSVVLYVFCAIGLVGIFRSL